MKLAIGLAVLSSACAQGGLEIGARVGYSDPTLHPDYSFITGFYQSITHHPYFGLSVSMPLTGKLGLRFDPVYQRIGYDMSAYGGVFSSTGQFAAVSSKQATMANRWQWPVLLEWRFAKHVGAGTGPSFSTLTSHRILYEVRNPFTTNSKFESNYPNLDRQAVAGMAAAIEFPFRAGPVIVASEVRYTRWTGKHQGGYWRLDEVSTGLAVRF